jgi:hypothetical protein
MLVIKEQFFKEQCKRTATLLTAGKMDQSWWAFGNIYFLTPDAYWSRPEGSNAGRLAALRWESAAAACSSCGGFA